MPALGPAIVTVAIVVVSAFIYTPGIGRGGWLLATLPLAPFIFIFLLLISRPRKGR
jgi:hypothetical protein